MLDAATVHVDAEVIVVDKPAGLVVHPGSGVGGGTLVNALLARYPDLAGVGDPERPGVVHRLDRGTSGLMVVARTPAAYESLVAQLADHRVARVYEALVHGTVEAAAGLVDAPIGRSSHDPTRRAVRHDGRPARTRYEAAARFTGPVPATLLRCRLETGRTHQIRVHLQAIGHPVVGDDRYGGRVPPGVALARPFLHAAELGFDHPDGRGRVAFEAQLPADLAAVLALQLNGCVDLGGCAGPHRRPAWTLAVARPASPCSAIAACPERRFRRARRARAARLGPWRRCPPA